MQHRFVICGGLSRSASTLQYNVTRHILSLNGEVHDYGYTKSEADVRQAVSAFDGSRHCVIKTHEYFDFYQQCEPSRGFRVLSSTRRLHEVIASSMRAYNATYEYLDERGVVARELRALVGYSGLPGALVQRYEELTGDLGQSVREIGAHLGYSLSPDAADSIREMFGIERQLQRMAAYNRTFRARAIRVINAVFVALNPTGRRPNGLILSRDPATGLHWNHISQDRGAVDIARVLTGEQIARIDAAIRASSLSPADLAYHLGQAA